MKKHCQLCDALTAEGQSKIQNTVLFETENYVVIPTIGQFVEGWLMIVAKRHVRRLADHSEAEVLEVEKLLEDIGPVLASIYGNYVIFEHGPSCLPGRHAGCCVEHTHIHLAPCKNAKAFLGKIPFPLAEESLISELRHSCDRTRAYVFAGMLADEPFVRLHWVDEPIPRQYMRQLLASVSNKSALWDWRQNPCHEEINRTVGRFSRTAMLV